MTYLPEPIGYIIAGVLTIGIIAFLIWIFRIWFPPRIQVDQQIPFEIENKWYRAFLIAYPQLSQPNSFIKEIKKGIKDEEIN